MPRHARSAIAFALLLACAAGAALAQSGNPASTNLSWDQCAGDGYVGDRVFACDTNTGSESFVLSLVLNDSTRTGIVGWQAKIDVTPVDGSVPYWWYLDGCRANGLTVIPDWSGLALPASTCLPWYGAQPASGGGGQFVYSTDRLYFSVIAIVMGDAVALQAGQEYALMRFTLRHAKSTGTGSCAGCAVPACIGLSRIELARGNGRPTDYFAGAGRNSVTWQGASVASYPTSSGAPCVEPSFCPYANQLQCTTPPVPAGGRTWGMIKTLYR